MSAHLHRCGKCKHVWKHNPRSFPKRKTFEGKEKVCDRAHACPECGYEGRENFFLHHPKNEAELLLTLPLTKVRMKG